MNHRWSKVSFTIYVNIAHIGKGTMREKIEASQVVGRVLGLRSDGQTYFCTIDLPWIWDRKAFRWKYAAKKRLNTLLSPECDCETSGAGSKLCKLHEELNYQWQREDRVRINYQGQVEELTALAAPTADRKSGSIEWSIMHRDFPWTRFDPAQKRFHCLICGFSEDAGYNHFNPTWRNKFIQHHSFCGELKRIPDVPKPTEDQVIEAIADRLEQKYFATRQLVYDTTRAEVLNLRGQLVVGEKELKQLTGVVIDG